MCDTVKFTSDRSFQVSSDIVAQTIVHMHLLHVFDFKSFMFYKALPLSCPEIQISAQHFGWPVGVGSCVTVTVNA